MQYKSEYQQYLSRGIDLLSDISSFYQKADAHLKRKLLGSIFPESLFFSIEKSRTTRLNEAVRLILVSSKGFGEQKTGQPFKNLTLSGEVETAEQKSNWLRDDLLSLARINI